MNEVNKDGRVASLKAQGADKSKTDDTPERGNIFE